MRSIKTHADERGFFIGCRESRLYRLTVTVECTPEEIIGIKEAIAAGARLGRKDTV